MTLNLTLTFKWPCESQKGLNGREIDQKSILKPLNIIYIFIALIRPFSPKGKRPYVLAVFIIILFLYTISQEPEDLATCGFLH